MVGRHGPFLCGAGAALGMSSLDWLPVTLGVGTLLRASLICVPARRFASLSLSLFALRFLGLAFRFWLAVKLLALERRRAPP